MQTKTVDVHEAQIDLVELLSLVASGTEIILTEGSTPLARIVPMASQFSIDASCSGTSRIGMPWTKIIRVSGRRTLKWGRIEKWGRIYFPRVTLSWREIA